MYNAKNYTEQGGEVTHIGGKLVFDEGGKIKNFPGAANQAASTAGSYTDLKKDFNDLLVKLKDAGLVIGDAWNISVKSSTAASLHDMPTPETLANSNHATLTIDGTKITVALDCKISELADADHGSTWGEHKWLGFGISTGLSSVAGIVYTDQGGSQTLSEADDTEASDLGLSAGDFIYYIKAENYATDNGTFNLSGLGFKDTAFTVEIVEDAE